MFTHVQSASATGSSTSISATFGSPVSSGNFVIVSWAASAGAFFAPTVSDDQGNSYTLLVNGPNAFDTFCGVAWLANITNGPRTITISAASGVTLSAISISEFSSGASAALDTVTSQTNSGGSNNPSPTITPANSGELIYAAGIVYPGGTIGLGSPWATLENPTANFMDAWQVQATAAPIQPVFTGSGTGVAAIAAFYQVTPLTADTKAVPAEFTAVNLRRDGFSALEALAPLSPGDTSLVAEYLSGGTIARSSPLKLEFLGGGATFDMALPMEALQAIDQPWLPVEWSTQLAGDINAPVESLHGPLMTNDAGVPIEMLGTTTTAVSEDAILPIEALATHRRGAQVQAESSATSAGGGVTKDSPVQIETTAIARRVYD